MKRALVVPSLLLACTQTPPAAPPSDASTQDLSPTDVALSDAQIDRVDATDAPRTIGPLAPTRSPQALRVTQWRTANLTRSASEDMVLPTLETGTFELPEPVGQTYGLYWGEFSPDDGGTLPPAPSGGVMYAAAEVDVPEGSHVFARADVMLGVYANGAVQPGDIYASGRIRVPVVTHAGRNVVVFREYGFRGTPRAELYATEDELYLNADDATVPDLPIGDTREQWVGLAVLNLTDAPALDVTARVEASDAFEATAVALPSLPAGAVTQVPFRVVPRAGLTTPEAMVTIGLRVESPSLHFSYRRELTLTVVRPDATHRRSFRSPMDLSAQYFGVVPPSAAGAGDAGVDDAAVEDAGSQRALVLSLHGASVEAIGQARAYSARPWTYVVAATNRRPYGFDWEEYGRHDAIEVLDHAMSIYPIDPTRVHLAGHSMGGHGTWNVGVLFPGRFATLGPSAGWSSFYSYTNRTRPTGAFARSQAASDTNAYLSNLAHRGVYVIHGSADDNVPVREGRTMSAAARMVTDDVIYHEQPGAGHWWDGDAAPGADCIDWVPLFEFMRAHRLDPNETDFRFTTPGVWVNPRHSFVTLQSPIDPLRDLSISSVRTGDSLALTTTNIRSMTLSAAGLRAHGIARVTVDGTPHDVGTTDLAIGPQSGKRPGVNGPLNEALQRPWCFVYPDDGNVIFRRYASYLTSVWSVNGNGHGCALPLSAVTEGLRRERNLVYVGVSASVVRPPSGVPFTWDATGATLGDRRLDGAAMVFVFPQGEDHLGAAFSAPDDQARLLYRVQPFASGFAVPDFMAWSAMGLQASGFFTPDWRYAPPSVP